MKTKTTAAHFKLFKNECTKWLKIFGMNDWEVFYTHCDVDDEEEKENRSSVEADRENGMASFYLGGDWSEHPLSNFEVRKAAFHEVRELFYWEIREAMRCFFSAEYTSTKIHRLIRVDEDVIFLKKR